MEEKRRLAAEKRWAEEDRLGIPTTTTTTTTTTTPKPYHERKSRLHYAVEILLVCKYSKINTELILCKLQ